jgi:hypothetical protein
MDERCEEAVWGSCVGRKELSHTFAVKEKLRIEKERARRMEKLRESECRIVTRMDGGNDVCSTDW